MKYWYMFPCEITEKSISDAIVDIFKQFHADPSLELTLYISSLGGDIDSAIRFYDFIKALGIKMNTVGFGQVDSAAIMLFLTGEERKLIKNCRVRLHLPRYNGPQQSQVISVHSETTLLLQQLDKRYFEILSAELSQKEEKLRDLFTKGKILTPDEALTLKIATKIEDKLPIERNS